MAIYHLSVKPVQRSKGRSATAAAAYRAGEVIECQREGRSHDYARRSGVAHTELVGWSGSREALWNAAEAEGRKNATTAREYEIALPDELGAEQQQAATRDLAEWLHDRHGVAVDIAIHDHDQHNPHAHVMATTRTVTDDGQDLGDKATVEWSDKKRHQHGLPKLKDELAAVREQWEQVANRHLEAAQEAARIDHRSLADQGADWEPTTHEGFAVRRIERIAAEQAQAAGIEHVPATDTRARNVAANNANCVRDELAALREQKRQAEQARQQPELAPAEKVAAAEQKKERDDEEQRQRRRESADERARELLPAMQQYEATKRQAEALRERRQQFIRPKPPQYADRSTRWDLKSGDRVSLDDVERRQRQLSAQWQQLPLPERAAQRGVAWIADKIGLQTPAVWMLTQQRETDRKHSRVARAINRTNGQRKQDYEQRCDEYERDRASLDRRIESADAEASQYLERAVDQYEELPSEQQSGLDGGTSETLQVIIQRAEERTREREQERQREAAHGQEAGQKPKQRKPGHADGSQGAEPELGM